MTIFEGENRGKKKKETKKRGGEKEREIQRGKCGIIGVRMTNTKV